jgi:hypothetical protein
MIGRWAGYWMLDDASDSKNASSSVSLQPDLRLFMSRQSASFARSGKRFVSDFEFIPSYSAAVNVVHK